MKTPGSIGRRPGKQTPGSIGRRPGKQTPGGKHGSKEKHNTTY
tara:strand:+ start:1500 stop:1628 length:129 start_codon:yes stop_codon:yes gene_type:complete